MQAHKIKIVFHPIMSGAKNPDAEIRDLLSNGGLGTGATRQEIIKKLKHRKFVAVSKKKLLSTPRARELLTIIRADGNRLCDVLATADLERELRSIEKDPSTAQGVWKKYLGSLTAEMDRLKRGSAPRKLTPVANRTSSYGNKSGKSGKGRRSGGSQTAKRKVRA